MPGVGIPRLYNRLPELRRVVSHQLLDTRHMKVLAVPNLYCACLLSLFVAAFFPKRGESFQRPFLFKESVTQSVAELSACPCRFP